ncbi:MAG: hypothetical protein V2B19_28275 [Pseudomonadota bacterium]
MTNSLTHEIIKPIGEQTIKGNAAFALLEQFVTKHIHEGWQVAGIAVSSVSGPRTGGSTRKNRGVRVALDLVWESEV